MAWRTKARSFATSRSRVICAAATAVLLVMLLFSGVAAAHERASIGPYDVEIGWIGEPVAVGQRSGVELSVRRADKPVGGLEKTLKVEVAYGAQRRTMDLRPAEGETGAYEAVFIPTAAGRYSFRLIGSIQTASIDRTFTSGPTTFDDVQDVASAQFPLRLVTAADVAEEAQRGAEAARLVTLATALGVTGTLVGACALGLALALARRRRS